MTFWLMVGLGYLLLAVAGVALGRYLISRFPRRGGGRVAPEPVTPAPTGPLHALEWLPLGTDFDRALLPTAFADGTVAADVG